jgi:UDP-N-acetylmuramyl pentapeptide phosphotransferase/UDP-N-acetylglucosamine-1-phosphate transferase/glycosyltransferase involved in cell wall biosynthesis
MDDFGWFLVGQKMGLYTYTFVGAAAASVVLTPLSMRLARVLGVVDRPNARKVHFRPTPRAGGVAIFAAMAAVVVPALLQLTHFSNSQSLFHIWIALAACTGVFLIGLLDDVITIKRAQYKLLALIAATATVCATGFKLDAISLGGGHLIPLGPAAVPITFLWIVGITTAVNFIDGLDGLAAGISAVAAGTIALLAASGSPEVAVIALGLLGSLCGFLIFNFNPARVFMGDCGSMFLGFTLATLSLICVKQTGQIAGFTLPAFALGIPILDTALTMVRRGVLQRRSLFAAERGHVHHRLMDMGVRHRDAVIILYAVTLACAGVGAASWASRSPVAATLCATIHPAILIFFFAAVGSLRVGVIVAAFRRNREIAGLTKKYRHVYDEMQLKFNTVRTFDAWWSEVCEALHRLDFIRLTLPITDRDGKQRILKWECQQCVSSELSLHVNVPIRQRRAGGPLRADVEVSAVGSLELGGRRATLFIRLMEEHSLASLPESRKSVTESIGKSASGPLGLIARVNNLRPDLRVAIVHDFLVDYGDTERVLEQMLNIFPQAQLFAIVDSLPEDQRGFLRGRTATTSFIQRLPFSRSRHRRYLPLIPLAIEQLDVSKFDLVLSSSYIAAKGVLTRPDQLHICYCHTPVRSAWDQQHQYLLERGMDRGLKSILARAILHYIRNWDARSANGVDVFLTNSDQVARRIEKFYRRRSTTIYPPVEVDQFPLEPTKEEYYLAISQRPSIDRIDLIVEAFGLMPGKRLIVIGSNEEIDLLKGTQHENVKLVGAQPSDRTIEYLRHAQALVFAADADFAVLPLEAMACGTPVIAYGHGGVTESVVPGKTGVYFDEQTTASLCGAVTRFEMTMGEFDPTFIRAHADKFNAARFREEFAKVVEEEWLSFTSVAGRHPAGEEVFLSPDLAQQSLKLRGKVAEAESAETKAFA